MIVVYAKRHGFHAGQQHGDMVDLYLLDHRSKPSPFGMVHVDMFYHHGGDNTIYDTLHLTDNEVELRILEHGEQVAGKSPNDAEGDES